ncbi:superoxide dismutase family protein [Leptobacterium flavescens]|uniref:Superoxide dismutase family protein n=1 Tax=Leptobacterium flavescens TaxID=472055 RepID=A0A6P0UQN1_9FLAO|nr:superoxide dismutase family protein [Leptobacterium flavescens]NER14129.1 superoxide dismutase family protein [Leptobacterium flavescens]
MKKISLFISMALIATTFSCKKADKKTEETVEEEIEVTETEEVKTISFNLSSKSESTAVGEVTFSEENGVVSMTANLSGLTEGEHAIHIHEKADCSSADGKSTGGHWNPTHTPHGKWGAEEGYHKGDIGNFIADAEGNGSISMSTDEWCIGCGDETKDILGKAIIVHQGTDDFVSQPSGAAGARVSCGGIIE